MAGARDFLRHAFADGPGEFGFRNHTMVAYEEEVVAVGAAARLAAEQRSRDSGEPPAHGAFDEVATPRD